MVVAEIAVDRNTDKSIRSWRSSMTHLAESSHTGREVLFQNLEHCRAIHATWLASQINNLLHFLHFFPPFFFFSFSKGPLSLCFSVFPLLLLSLCLCLSHPHQEVLSPSQRKVIGYSRLLTSWYVTTVNENSYIEESPKYFYLYGMTIEMLKISGINQRQKYVAKIHV